MELFIKKGILKTLSPILIVALILAIAAGGVFVLIELPLLGSIKTYEQTERRESRVYGQLEKVPEGFLGIWVVNGKKILVTKDTFLKEEHLEAKAGDYVVADCRHSGKTLTAYKLEITKAGR